MSTPHEREHWLERNWYFLVILFGLLLVLSIDLFFPTI